MFFEEYFYNWMITKHGLQKSVANTNLARARRIDEVYNLFDAYLDDNCSYILSLFEYSAHDAEKGLFPEHDIVINGNYYTGTQSLKYALNLYIKALEDADYFSIWINDASKTNSSTITDDDFNTLLNTINITTPLEKNISQIFKKYRETDTRMETDQKNNLSDTSQNSTANNIPRITFTGNFQAFQRYIGPYCKNYVNSITKSERKSHNGICEYCGKKAILDSAHKDGEDRPIIIKKILEKHFKKSEDYYEVDILAFEKMFKNAHLPINTHIFFLCKDCHTEYDNGTKITTADILAKR